MNNASAISLTGTAETPMKRYDLMHQVNTRGTFLCSQACIPHLAKAREPAHPEHLAAAQHEARWFAPHVAYTMAKFGMSMCVLGMAEELRDQGIAVNALWPRTVDRDRRGRTCSAATRRRGAAGSRRSWPTRRTRSSGATARACTGNFFIDEEVLRAEGVTDFAKYAVEPGMELLPDLFLG